MLAASTLSAVLLVLPMSRLLPCVDFRNSEVPAEFAELIGIDGALNADDGQLLRFRGQDREAADLSVLGLDVHLGVVAGFLAAHSDNPRPGRSVKLCADGLHVGVLIFSG